MKKIIFLILLLSACANSVHMQTAETVEDAIMYIETYQGEVKDFRLGLKETVLVKGTRKATREYAVGAIGKAILDSRDWYFDGHEDKDDLRVYRFKMQEN
jgi:hypothetical protein